MKNLNRVIARIRRRRRQSNLRYGSISMEFAILLGVVFMAFMAMNTYMKRGLQGRVKDMADNLISNEQVVEVNTGYTTSASSTNENATSQSELFQGGGTKISLASNKQYGSSAIYDDNKDIVVSASPIPSEHGQTYHPGWDNVTASDVNNRGAVGQIRNSTNAANGVTNYSNSTVTSDAQSTQVLLPVINTAEYGNEDAYIDDQAAQGNLEAMRTQRDRLASQASSLRLAAAEIEAKGRMMMRSASGMDCDDSRSCKRAKRDLRCKGASMVYKDPRVVARYCVTSPDMIGKDAQSLREQAAALERQIEELDRVIGSAPDPGARDEGDVVDEGEDELGGSGDGKGRTQPQ